MKGQVTGIWVLIIGSNKTKLIKCVVAVNGKHLCLQDISSQQVGPLGFLFKAQMHEREREREPLSAGVQEGHFSLIVATSSNVNSWRGYGAWLWDKCYYLLLEVGALGIQVGRRPGQGPLDTIVMSKEIHHQGEIQDTKIEELCMPSAHKEIPAFM